VTANLYRTSLMHYQQNANTNKTHALSVPVETGLAK